MSKGGRHREEKRIRQMKKKENVRRERGSAEGLRRTV